MNGIGRRLTPRIHRFWVATQGHIIYGQALRDPTSGRRYVIHQVLAGATVRVAPVTETRVWTEIGSEGDARALSASTLAKFEPA